MTKHAINLSNISNTNAANKISPKIILESLIEINSNNSINTIFSDKEIFLILKYLNDFITDEFKTISFERLKELKIYKPLWFDAYVQLSSNAGKSNEANVYLISEEMAAIMKRCFKKNPFEKISTDTFKIPSLKSPELFSDNSSTHSSFKFIIKHSDLADLFSHMNLHELSDLDFFSNLCIPLFFDLNARTQFVLLEHLNEEILSKKFANEKDKYLEVLRKNLVIQTRRKDEPKLVSDLYDPNNETLKKILDDSYFPDEAFETSRCLKFLKTIGLQTCLSNDLCKILMNDIEYKVSQEEEAGAGWTDELRERSKYLYLNLVENCDRLDESILEHRFLEPYCPSETFLRLAQPFEYKEFSKTCIKLSDAELHKYEHLAWTSSFLLPSFVQTENMNEKVLEFLKLNRKPNFLTVNQNISNLCESFNKKEMDQLDDELESFLMKTLAIMYKYFNDLSQHDQAVVKELLKKEIVWSSSSKKFVSPEMICLDIEEKDEIVPFLYSLPSQFKHFKTFFIRLGATEKAHPMVYGNILKKMAFVCGQDYLNSNELCKALKAEEEFFRLLRITVNSEETETKNEKSENTTAKTKLTGLYFVSTELKLEKSGLLTILDNSEQLNYVLKLPNEKYLFNPSEKLFKTKTLEIKPLLNAIHVAQRPTLFSFKYEENYDFSLPEDFASQSQQMLICIECYYQEMFHNQQFQRSIARTISDKEARQSSPKYLSIDHIQKIIGDRFSTIKFKCVEHLETALSCNKQKKLEQTIEERACYLTYETSKFVTIYISKKHVKLPYFPLCLARTLQPILDDLNYDHSICASLIASSAPQMNNLLHLANVSNEANILTVIKQTYVPMPGGIYADDVSLLSQYNMEVHEVIVGDLCVYFKPDGNYIYCKIISINSIKKPSEKALEKESSIEKEFTIQIDVAETENIKISQKDLYVLENWKRVNEAVVADPPSEVVHLEKMNLQRDPENYLNIDEQDSNENEFNNEKIEELIKPLVEYEEQTGEPTITITTDILSTRLNRKENSHDNLSEALLWLKQAKSDLESAENDMNPSIGKPAFEWVAYKCYRAVEKTLRGYHVFRGNGNKLPSTIFGNDLRRLLLGIDTNVRDVAFKFCNIAGNESKTMQYPDFSRSEQPNQKEIFLLSQKHKSEKALSYGKEVVELVDQIINSKAN